MKKPADQKVDQAPFLELPEEYRKHLERLNETIEGMLNSPAIRDAGEQLAQLNETINQTMNMPAIQEAARQSAELAATAREMLNKARANPESDGWLRLCEILSEAKRDRRIIASAGASDFLELMWLIAADSITAPSLDEALQPFISDLKSSDSSDMAIKRWKEEKKARDWVIREWGQHKSEYRSKADFSRIYARRVLSEFEVKVTDRNIRERWLKGI